MSPRIHQTRPWVSKDDLGQHRPRRPLEGLQQRRMFVAWLTRLLLLGTGSQFLPIRAGQISAIISTNAKSCALIGLRWRSLIYNHCSGLGTAGSQGNVANGFVFSGLTSSAEISTWYAVSRPQTAEAATRSHTTQPAPRQASGAAAAPAGMLTLMLCFFLFWNCGFFLSSSSC